MNANSNLNWGALFCYQLVIQTFNGAQNFAPCRHSIAGVIRTGVACAEDRHETVAQIFVDHATMFFLNRTHAYAEKIVHDLHDFRRRRRARAGCPRPHINEHDSDFLFDTAQSRVAREVWFPCGAPYVQAESLAQFLLIPELTDHLVEFTEQPAKFIGAPSAGATKIDGQVSARNRVG